MCVYFYGSSNLHIFSFRAAFSTQVKEKLSHLEVNLITGFSKMSKVELKLSQIEGKFS